VREHYPEARVIFVPNRRYWNPSEARNLGAAGLKDDWLCFLDADVILSDSFASVVRAHFREGVYLAAPAVNGIYGLTLCPSTAFRACGGYDRLMAGGRYEDVDFREALRHLGLTEVTLPQEIMLHIDHDDELRTSMSDVKGTRIVNMINRSYSTIKTAMRDAGRELDDDGRRDLYGFIKSHYTVDPPYSCWGTIDRSHIADGAMAGALMKMIAGFDGIEVEAWGGVRRYLIKRKDGASTTELVSTYDTQTAMIRAPGRAKLAALSLSGETLRLPVEGGQASLRLTKHAVFIGGDVALTRRWAVDVLPSPGPSVRVCLQPAGQEPTGRVTVEVAVDGGLQGTAEHSLSAHDTCLYFPVQVKEIGRPQSVRVRVTGDGVSEEVIRKTSFLTAGRVSEIEAWGCQPPRSALIITSGGDAHRETWRRDDVPHPGRTYSVSMAWGWTEQHLVCWCEQDASALSPAERVPSTPATLEIAIEPRNTKMVSASHHVFRLRPWGADLSLEWERVGNHDAAVEGVYSDWVTARQDGERAATVLRIPFASLDVTPEVGLVIGAAAVLRSSGADGSAPYQWGSGNDIAGDYRYKNPHYFSEIVLAPSDALPKQGAWDRPLQGKSTSGVGIQVEADGVQ
jgi:hypothetical protein